ncbi:sigma-70 family RNA polymerase sigma factor [Actinokineospora sp. NPDC004072]
MSTVPADVDGPSDADLLESVRGGAVSDYGTLYERHVAAAYNLARQLTRSPAEADDLVSEAFAKVLDTLRHGRGPESAFRAYLLTALRHTAYDKTRRDRRVEFSDDVTQVSGVDPAAVSVPFTDTAVAGLDRSLAARAFARLPERWQAVLWHTEIEGQSPAQVAPLLGLTPNGVSALAYRAREGLRQAYLQVHLAETDAQSCRAATERLGAWVRGGLAKRETAQVEAHLDQCDRCRALAAELADINGGLRVFIAPLVLGTGAAAAYLAAAKATAAGAVAAAGAGASASGVAGAISGAPRQVLGVAASGVALVAAIAVGLTGGSAPPVPAVAAPPPPVTTQAPQPTAPQSPQPSPAPYRPSPAPQPPAPQPQQPPPADPVPPHAPAPVQPPPEPAPEPTPGPPSLATDPLEPVALVVGGGPADLPITVRNTGGSVSEPVVATLALPRGVRAVEGQRLGAEPLLRLNAAPQTGTVRCPGGSGTVTCTSGDGLLPGESVTLVFRLVATPGSAGSTITGSVTAGSAIRLSISVPIQVREKPDGIRLTADAHNDGWFETIWPWGRDIILTVRARNTGESTKPIEITADVPGKQISGPGITCATDRTTTTCRTRDAVEPGEGVRLQLRVRRHFDHPNDLTWRDITVTGTLGTAVQTVRLKVPPFGPWWPQVHPPHPPAPADPPAPPVPPTRPEATGAPTAPPSAPAPPAEQAPATAVPPAPSPTTSTSTTAPTTTPPTTTTAPSTTTRRGKGESRSDCRGNQGRGRSGASC